MDERGYITRFEYDIPTGGITRRVDDVDTSIETDHPPGWSTPADGGKNLVTDYELDLFGREIQSLGPVHVVDINGTPMLVRTATWTVYDDSASLADSSSSSSSEVPAAGANITRMGRGYTILGPAPQSSSSSSSDSSTLQLSDSSTSSVDYDFVLINPVSITKTDKDGNVLEEIEAIRHSDSSSSSQDLPEGYSPGKLLPTDQFPQSSYARLTTHQYTDCCLLTATRVYHTIPAAGVGLPGVHYDQTDFGYDAMQRQNRVTTPGGTITWTVFDARGLVVATYVGTDATGGTDEDPTGGAAGPALGNNMVLVTENEYDHGLDGYDGNPTRQTQYVSAKQTRVTNHEYDCRNRLTWTDGEEDYCQHLCYDNLDRIIRTERYDTTPTGNLIARSDTKFDDRSRVFRTIAYGVDPATGTIGNALTSNTWFDPSSNVIKSQPSGSQLFTKSTYDSLGRQAFAYLGFDLDESTYSQAETITGDTILEQTQSIYDDASNVIETVNWLRYHDTTGTGALNGPDGPDPQARVLYSAAWPDPIGRMQATADYGTNGGTPLARSSTIPERSDNVRVLSTTFDAAGSFVEQTDPAGTVTRFEYDDAGRPIVAIANYREITSSSSSNSELILSSSSSSTSGTGGDCLPSDDVNRTTIVGYNADGNVETRTAVNPTTGDQVTTYVYGTTLADSEIATTLLLRAVIYPDSTDLDSSSSSSSSSPEGEDRVSYTYNRQAERTTRTDQNGTVRTFDHDGLGRPTHDRVTTIVKGVDDSVLRISATYEVRGLLATITSYDNPTPGQGNVVNQVEIAVTVHHRHV